MKTYFVHLTIREDTVGEYVIGTYESDDYATARAKYDGLCAGNFREKEKTLYDRLFERKARTPSLKLTVYLTEAEMDEEDELGDSRCLDRYSLIA